MYFKLLTSWKAENSKAIVQQQHQGADGDIDDSY